MLFFFVASCELCVCSYIEMRCNVLVGVNTVLSLICFADLTDWKFVLWEEGKLHLFFIFFVGELIHLMRNVSKLLLQVCENDSKINLYFVIKLLCVPWNLNFFCKHLKTWRCDHLYLNQWRSKIIRNVLLFCRIENSIEILTLKIGLYDWTCIFYQTDIFFLQNGMWAKMYNGIGYKS
jgi:hypothetical protein